MVLHCFKMCFGPSREEGLQGFPWEVSAQLSLVTGRWLYERGREKSESVSVGRKQDNCYSHMLIKMDISESREPFVSLCDCCRKPWRKVTGSEWWDSSLILKILGEITGNSNILSSQLDLCTSFWWQMEERRNLCVLPENSNYGSIYPATCPRGLTSSSPAPKQSSWHQVSTK